MIFIKSISQILSENSPINLDLKCENGFIYNENIDSRLYLTFHQNTVIITDNINELKNIALLHIDKDAAEFYLRYGFIVPPFTLYKDVYLLAPYLGFSLTSPGVFTTQYPPISNSIISEENCCYELAKNIKESLDAEHGKYQVLFSGGIDSSLLLGLSHEMAKTSVAINCHMSSMPEESEKAKKMCESKKIAFKKFAVRDDLTAVARHFIDYTAEPVADRIALVIPEMLAALEGGTTKVILDGQGADSLFCGLPHDKLYDLFNNDAYRYLAKIMGWLPACNNKNSAIGRKLYRIAKVIKCLSAPNPIDMLIRSLIEDNSSTLSGNNKVQRWLTEELWCIDSKLVDFHLTMRYFFLFRVLPAREMQKYALAKKKGYAFKLPFLEKSIISKYFYLRLSLCVQDGVYKYPIVFLAKKYWPGYIGASQTSPFQVEFKTGTMTVRDFSLSHISR